MNEEDQIFEAGEYCDKCFGTTGLGQWMSFYICRNCWSDQTGMRNWVAAELEEVLENNPEYEKTADGKFRRKVL